MKDPDYSNREINEMVSDIKDALIRIETQTTKTNGRVSKLEQWQYYIKGGLAVVILLLIPIAIFFIEQTIQQAKTHEEIQTAVTDAISPLLEKYNHVIIEN